MKIYLLTLALILALLAACSPVGPAAGPTDIQTGVDPQAWAKVPAGEYFMGQHEHEKMVDYDYEIMVTDVTNAQYADYLNRALSEGVVEISGNQVLGYYPGDEYHAHEHEQRIDPGDYLLVPLEDAGLRLDFDAGRFAALPGYENHPMVLVTWFGAQSYCQFHGWRLPTEVEWEKAARGVDKRPFPWGDEIAPENANYYSSYDIFEKTLGKGGSTTPVGFYNGGVYDGFQTLDSASPYGLYDMAGNVWQWCGDVYPDQHYRYMRGGSKDNYAYNLRVWTRNSAGPSYYSPAVGFRCGRTP